MSAPVVRVPAPPLTPDRAKLILQHPRFGDAHHIEANRLLELADDLRRTREEYHSIVMPWWATPRLERRTKEELEHELRLWLEFRADSEPALYPDDTDGEA